MLLFRIIGIVGRDLSHVSLGFMKDQVFHPLLVFGFTVLVQWFATRYRYQSV